MSDKIFRYSPVRFGQLEVDANGAFVFYADVAPLEARIEEQRQLIASYVRNNTIQCQRIAALEAELKKHQESEFHPDWSMLEATRASLREHMQKIAEQAAEIERLKNKPTYRMRQEQKDNYCELIEELEQRIADLKRQIEEWKYQDKIRMQHIDEQAAEIERLKVANEGWHRRVQEFGAEKESYQQRIEELEARIEIRDRHIDTLKEELRTQKDECERIRSIGSRA